MTFLHTRWIIMFNILVTGAKGQLGCEIKALSKDYPFNFFFTCKEELNICDEQAIRTFVAMHNINAIVNCAAYTAVDKAESESKLANLINHHAVKNLALISKEKNIKLIHISTDYVFDGTNHQPYIEEDTPNALSIYGQTKLDAEMAIQEINPKGSIIIRSSWIYSSHGNNFVKTMLRLGNEKEFLGVIYDQVGTPTYARDLAKVILDILPKLSDEDVMIYHYSNEGVLSWYDFAKEIMKMAKLTCKIYPIETKDYPTAAKRPHYALLNKSKIKKSFDIEIPFWKDSLDECLRKMGKRS